MPATPRRSTAFLAGLFVAVGTPLFAGEEVTFARDVAAILQQKCQVCHRPGAGAPMSLLTYEDVRPWARAIRQRVVRHEMPPWQIVPNRGIQRFKNDPSLSPAQIEVLTRWVDAGAPLGNPRDLPAPVVWPDADAWQNGTPDLILSLPPRKIPAAGSDIWQDFILDTRLAEDRYIRVVETRPSPGGRSVVHHVATFLIQDGTEKGGSYLSEYALGKSAERFSPDTGRLMSAGAQLRVNVHDHPTGFPITDRLEVGLFFYPRDRAPRHEVVALTVGLLFLDDDLDIPANTVTTHLAAAQLTRPARLISFQPHMHRRGRAMTLEAILPDGRTEVLGAVEPYDFDTQTAYVFDDEASPVLPAGTILQVAATYDNTAANRRNPDPDQWVGFGNRTIDEMLQCHVLMTYLDDEEYAPGSGKGVRPRSEP